MISLVIPCLNSARFLPFFRTVFLALEEEYEVIIVDSSSDDETVDLANSYGWRTISIARNDFDHGGSRNLGAREAKGDVVVFLSHDVKPVLGAISTLVRTVREAGLACAYGRQVAGPNATLAERCLRMTNYGDQSYVYSAKDIERLGLAVAFFSDAFSAYDRTQFAAVGGFSPGLILGEDTEICMRFLIAGARVGYSSEAVVEHTHNYSLTQEFRRSFDIGVFHRQRRDLIHQFGGVGGKGAAYLTRMLKMAITERKYGYLLRGPFLLATRAMGFLAGKKLLWAIPQALRRGLSYHPKYWVTRD